MICRKIFFYTQEKSEAELSSIAILKDLVQNKYLSLFIVIGISAFMLFARLDSDPIIAWDESRQAINAIEMLDHKNPLISTYKGETDFWNTKPSLLIASQSFLMKNIGINELALRLPSAFAGLFLCILIYLFFVIEFKSKSGGILAVLTLLSMEGYNGYHCTRTGDFDSLLCLFTTTYLMAFYIYLVKLDKRYLVLFFISIALTVFSKGVAGLMFLPALFFYLLYTKKLLVLLRLRLFWVLFLSSSLLILSYYLYREIHSPGFIKAVNENELLGRFGKSNYGHSGPYWMYVAGLFSKRAFPWIIFLPIGLGIWYARFRYFKKTTSAISYFNIMLLFWLFMISIAQTKIEWYDAPMIPLIAIVFSLVWVNIFKTLLNPEINFSVLKLQTRKLFFGLGLTAYLLLFVAMSHHVIYKELPTCTHCIESNQFGSMINSGLKKGRNFDGYFWSTPFEYSLNQVFYIEKLKRNHQQILLKKSPSEWQEGDKIFLLHPTMLDSIPSHLSVKNKTENFSIIEIELELLTF